MYHPSRITHHASRSSPMYAEIAVNISLGPWTSGQGAPPPSYHYRVPSELTTTIALGQLVRVPFGGRPAQGIVLALHDHRPDLPTDTTIRPIEAISDTTPILSEAHLELARWMADATLSPLAETVWSMLPPGLEEKAHGMVELTDDGRRTMDGRLGPVQKAILAALKEHGPTRLDQLAERAGVKTTTALASLIERGLARKRWKLEPPSVRPRTVRVAVLTRPPDLSPTDFTRLGRETAEATALAWLTASHDPLPTVAGLQTATGVTNATLRRLVGAGIIGLTERRSLIALRVSRAEIARLLAPVGPSPQPSPTQGRGSKPAQPERPPLPPLSPTDSHTEGQPLPPLSHGWERGQGGEGASLPSPTSKSEPGGEGLPPASPTDSHSEGQPLPPLSPEWERGQGGEGASLPSPTDSHTAGQPLPPLAPTWERGQGGEGLPPLSSGWERGQGGEGLLRLLRLLLDSPVPLDLATLRSQGISPHSIKKLEAQGLVQRIEDEPSVYLTIPPDDIPTTLVKLRQADAQLRVIEHLRAYGPEYDAAELARAVNATLDDLRALETLGWLRLDERVAWRDPLAGQTFVAVTPPRLTDDQTQAWQTIQAAFDEPDRGRPFLLHGVTGSGKTEIYLRGVEVALARGRQALILVPEISLTPQTVRRFAARFAGRVSVWHSELTPGQRYDTWQRIRNGEVDVIVGSRSALFTPLWRLGLIVMDEEHEPSYKQDQTPRYHARDTALRLARLTQSVLILGSATPDIETYAQAERGELTLLRLPRRVLGHRQAVAEQQARLGLTSAPAMRPIGDLDALYADLPPVQIVDLRAELRSGNTSLFSRALQNALRETLDRRQQAILFLNRRGAATFVMCRDCGHVLECPRCSSSLTYHQASGALVCHHCGHRQTLPRVCPVCHSERIKHFGAGTQRVEDNLLALLPDARVIRWDRDTTGGKTAHSDFLDAFIQGDADVLIGTQMIAKGLDLPLVTLVGVVSADTGLHLPDFRAAERSFQLLTQVAGRAARGPLGGRVIFQTYTPEHYAIQTAARHDYEAFYAAEMEFRRSAVYPPYSRLARLIYTDPTWDKARAESETLARKLTDYIRRQGFANTTLIGPAPAFFGRERGEYRWHIVVRSADPVRILRDFLAQDRPPYGWRIDINPVSLL